MQTFSFLLIGLLMTIMQNSYANNNTAKFNNFLAIDANLHISGQPNQDQLAQLHKSEYTQVINLLPTDGIGFLNDESTIIGAQNITYINIPIEWNNMQLNDFNRFTAILQATRKNKTLVHCYVNKRASLFIFLYRAIYEPNQSIDEAYEEMTQLWVPTGKQKAFANKVLNAHSINFRIDE